MKFKKIFVFLVLFFIGIIGCKAVGDDLYARYEKFYRVLGAELYYYNYSTDAEDLEVVWQEANSHFDPFPSDGVEKLKRIWNEYYAVSSSEQKLKQEQTYSNFLHQIATELGIDEGDPDPTWQEYTQTIVNSKNLPEMFNYAYKCINGYAGETNDRYKSYEDLINKTAIAYSSFCEYLKSHPGISYYIQKVLQIISYAVLALAIILGGIDFVEAILSNEDNALNKAFQKFIRRLIAAALVFLSYIIVQIFLGLVSNVNGATQAGTQICEELKLGALGNYK